MIEASCLAHGKIVAWLTNATKVYWYTPTELAKRMGFYHSCQALGSMMSGALQVAVINTLEGSHGLAGWRWLFVINAIMTVVVGMLGFFLLPDVPHDINPRAFWFKKEHAKLALERLDRHGRTSSKKMTWAGAKYVSYRYAWKNQSYVLMSL